MSEMLMIVCIIVLMITSISPVKVTFMLVMASIMVSLSSYMYTTSVFPGAAMVISFSSGMMILFCYCSMMSNYESKKSMSKTMTLSLVIYCMATSLLEENSSNLQSITSMSMVASSPFLVLSMMVVLMCMVCINKSMFSPSKTLMVSY